MFWVMYNSIQFDPQLKWEKSTQPMETGLLISKVHSQILTLNIIRNG